jgi:uncharacterized lipoprotein YbaY
MKLRDSVATRTAVLVVVSAAMLVMKPAPIQGRAAAPQGVVEDHPAVAGEVLVKFRRMLAPQEQAQLDDRTDADRNEGIGGTGVRLIHSRTFDTRTLIDGQCGG